MILDSKLGKKVYNFLKNPLVTLAIGIIIPTISSLVSSNEKSPRYYFSKPQLIAEKENTQGNLQILWGNKPIPNVYSVDFTFWNNGRKYIDPTDFIKSSPIKVYHSGQIKILSVSQIKISRDEINFRPEISDSLRSTFNIYLENGETLEHNDGLTYHILYSMVNGGKWKLDGRIKGFPNGFEKTDLSFNEKGKQKRTLLILWSTFFIFILIRIIVLWIAKKKIVFRPFELVFILVLLILTSYMTIEYYFFNIHLSWF